MKRIFKTFDKAAKTCNRLDDGRGKYYICKCDAGFMVIRRSKPLFM